MSRSKKILLASAGSMGVLLAALLALPLAFADQIESRVRAEVERAARVRVSWDDVGLTFFRDFPHLTLSMSRLEIVGTGRFDGDTLATVGRVQLALDVSSVLGAARGRAPLVVRNVRIDAPDVRLRVDGEGVASWDVLSEREPPAADGSQRNMRVSLRSFELTNGDLVLDNEQSGLFMSMRGLRHSLRGDFSRDSLVANTRLHSDELTLRFAGVPYLGGVAVDFDADVEVDVIERRGRLRNNELRLNDLAMRVDGDVGRDGPNLSLDLTFEAPSTEFGQLLSLVPTVYAQDFASLETSGTFSLAGEVQGAYGKQALPSFSLRVAVTDGSFRYPDLPLPARAITANLTITNPGGDLDSTVVNVPRFHIEIDGQPLDAAVVLRTPVSDLEADVRVNGTLDLADLARTVKLNTTNEPNGIVAADAHIRARRSDIERKRYERIDADGTINVRDLELDGPSMRQPVAVRSAEVRLTPRSAELRTFDSRMGSSDLRATGRLDNLLGFALGQQPLTGSVSVASDRFDLDEWRSDSLAAIPVPASIDLTIDGLVGELVFNGLEMTNARGRAVARNQRLTLEGFSLQTLGGRIGVDGFYETVDPTRPTFALNLVLDSLDVAGASAALLTVRTLAPVARYARGTFSSVLRLSGALGEDLTPDFELLDGDGSLSTSPVTLEGFPILDRLAGALSLQRLSNPTMRAIRSSIRIESGRLIVNPFQAAVGGVVMAVSGSNGIDQSLDYSLELQVPRAGLAADALASLASKAGPLGARLSAVDPVRITARVTGTITQPSLTLGLSEAGASLLDAATQEGREAVTQRIDDAQERLDASREEALARARARADSIVAGAQRQADALQSEARQAAAVVRAEGARAADEVLARATNPLARAAAQPLADRLRREADARAAAIEREADERGAGLVAEAQALADQLTRGSG